MPEHVSTDNVQVARILAVTELTKGATVQKTPEALGETYEIIYKAILKAGV